MGKLSTDFNVTFNNNYGRPCLVSKPTKEDDNNEEKAMFHKWVVTEEVVSPRFGSSRNPLPWGQRSVITGLVEFEDGRLDIVSPHAITFVDGKVGKLFAETAVFCEKNDYGYPKHVEGFIKSCSFKVAHYQGAVKYITVKRFVEALEEYFDYKWNEDEFHSPAETPSKTVEEFVHNGMHFEDLDRPVSSDRDRVITLEWAKEALKRYFNYEWSDEIYDKY